METERGKIGPSRALPESYSEIWGLDLSKNRRAALALNISAIPLFLISGWLFVKFAAIVRPDIIYRNLQSTLTLHPLLFPLLLLLVVGGMMILHEAIHGLFFWFYTRTRPVFGIRVLFAYAGAPGWYIPRDQYAIIGLAPLVVMTLLGFLLIPFVPLLASRLILFGIVMNASGAVGDLYVVGRVLQQSRDVVIQDSGFGFTVFGRPLPAFPR